MKYAILSIILNAKKNTSKSWTNLDMYGLFHL